MDQALVMQVRAPHRRGCRETSWKITGVATAEAEYWLSGVITRGTLARGRGRISLACIPGTL